MAAQEITRVCVMKTKTVDIGCRDAGSCTHPPQIETDGQGMSLTP